MADPSLCPMEAIMIADREQDDRPSTESRPVRRLVRVSRNFLCEVFADGVSLEGRTVNLNEQDLSVLLSEPLFAQLDSTTVVLTGPDGSLLKLTGRVIRQQRIGVGEVLVGIQLAELPVDASRALIEKCAPDSPFQIDTEPVGSPEPRGLLGRLRAPAGFLATPVHDRRRIPRLPIHTVCTILGDEPFCKGLAHDLSYTGFSVLFPDFNPGRLWGAMFQIKFVKLKALPIGIEHRGPATLVRFRVEHIQEGEERWRDLHYSYWRHLS